MFQAGRLAYAKALRCKQHVVGGELQVDQCWGAQNEIELRPEKKVPEDRGVYCTYN